jgi:hypothetical protein
MQCAVPGAIHDASMDPMDLDTGLDLGCFLGRTDGERVDWSVPPGLVCFLRP